MDISQLPSPGPDFLLNDPHQGFRRKLNDITLKSEYKNLHNDIDLIIDSIEPYLEIIKRGGIDRSERFHIWEKIRAADKGLSHWDMELIMNILEKLSR